MSEKAFNYEGGGKEFEGSDEFFIGTLRSLKEKHSNQPVPLTREKRFEYDGSVVPEEKEILKRYEQSKFRVNWFNGVFMAIEMLLEKNREKFRGDPEFEKIDNERIDLLEDFRKLDTQRGNPIPQKMVEDADALIEKVINKLSK